MSFNPQAKYVQGEPLMIDYTPGTAVPAGNVVVVGGAALIAHVDVAANQLAGFGLWGGVYDFKTVALGTAAPTFGTSMYWDEGAGAPTTTSGSNAFLGVCVEDVGATATTIRIARVPAV